MLDLSRNALRSLAGLDSLVRLEVLSVYMNQVSDAAELVRLRANCKLRSLDARLNPVTRSRFWRPFVLQSLPALQTLDAQQVMAAETRRAAARPPLAPTDLADRAAAESSDASDGEAEGGEREPPAAPSWPVRAAPAAAAPAGAAPAGAAPAGAAPAGAAPAGAAQAGAAPAGAAPAAAAPAGAAQAVNDPSLRHLGSSTRSSGSSRSDASGAKSSSSISVRSRGSSGINSTADMGAFAATAPGAPGAPGAQAAAFAALAAAVTSTPGDEPLSPLDGVLLAEELNRAYDAVLASEESSSPAALSSRSPSPSPSASRSPAPASAPEAASLAASSAGGEPEPTREDDSLDGSLLKLLKFARRLEAPCSAQGWDTSMAELNECLVSVVACRKADKARAERDSAARLALACALEARTAERDALAAALAAQRRELQRAEERAEGKPALEAASPEQLAAQRVPAMLLEAHNALIDSNRALLAELDDTRARYRADEEQWRANFDRLKALYTAAKEQQTTL